MTPHANSDVRSGARYHDGASGQAIIAQYTSPYLGHAIEAAGVLQRWYNETTGLWDTTGWWNSANCITMLADLTALNPDLSMITGHVFENTFAMAPGTNLYQVRSADCHFGDCLNVDAAAGKRRRRRFPYGGESSTKNGAPKGTWRGAVNRNQVRHTRRGTTFTTSSASNSKVQVEDTSPSGFLNGFYDDESWWALAWIKVYDLTKDEKYLTAAEVIFQDLRTTATNAACGGVWWDRAQTANTAISNALYVAVAAQLALHVPARSGFYLNYALANWQWFEASGLINGDNQINDGIDLQTCQNNGADVWSYNQGVILGALVSLSALTNNATMIDIASNVADAAITRMVDANGNFHDPHEPDLGGDGPQFKGVFARNLKELYKVNPKAAYKSFLETNADSIWNNARDSASGVITTVWSGPFDQRFAGAAGHSSGMDALVAAAAIQ